MANHVGPNTSQRQGYKMVPTMAANSTENVQVSQRHVGPEPATIARNSSLQSTKEKYSLLIEENVFLDLFAMVFEEHNLKSSIIWKNEHSFSIIWPKIEQCYWHNMLLLLSQIYHERTPSFENFGHLINSLNPGAFCQKRIF